MATWRRRVPLLLVVVFVVTAEASAEPDWAAPMRAVHARFSGRPGTFAHFGDSITVTMAFWTPMLYARKNAPTSMEDDFAAVKAYLKPECWRDWKGPAFGSQGSMTVRWAHQNVAAWLTSLNPETALIMFGTNDLHSLDLDEYRTKLGEVVQKCLDNGTVVILSTIPPRHCFVEKAAAFARAGREVAAAKRVPLIDFHAEVLARRPDDWDGALDRFKEYSGYDVPTLIARDGVHPSHPQAYRDDYSADGLSRCGFSLRNYLVLTQYAEVMRTVLQAPAGAAAKAPTRPWFPKAPPLARATGTVIRVATVDELYAAARQVEPGGTISLAAGLYRLPRFLELKTDRVTLRGESGDRDAVVLDGGGIGELIWFTRCADVTVADLTIQNVKWNGFKINSQTGVQRLTIRNCVIHNVWQRGVKGVKVPAADRERLRPTGCRVEYCLFYNDRPKRLEDDEADPANNFGGNYIGGIDVMYAKGWTISDNVFIGIRGRTGEARGAVFLWHEAEDCVVERNIIVDCDSGICLGNSHKPADVQTHATRCTVRNNFVTRAHENALLADYTTDCRILNNTVHDPASRLGRLIRIVHDADGLVVANNLLSGPAIRNESKSPVALRNNVAARDLASAFADANAGDLHLKTTPAGVADAALPLDDVRDDIDGQPRGPKPDVGADELPAPAGG